MFRQSFLYIVICTLILVAGCGSTKNVDNSNDKQPVDNSSGEKSDHYVQIIEPNNTLGFALLNKVDSDKNDNIFISPTSALMALSMVQWGGR